MRKRATTAALIVAAALALAGCGKEHATAGENPGVSDAGSNTPSSRNTSGSPEPTPTPSAPPASPYVEPGAGDGAPHYRENNGFRIPADMSPASAADAQREAARIEPVLKRLWQQKTWDPATVRTAMLQLGYKEQHFDAKGRSLGGMLQVKPMDSRYENGGYVTPEGARVGLRIHDDACVTAFIQKTNYQVSTNGPYPEGGCFEPRGGH